MAYSISFFLMSLPFYLGLICGHNAEIRMEYRVNCSGCMISHMSKSVQEQDICVYWQWLDLMGWFGFEP